jgi:hypothetical protein
VAEKKRILIQLDSDRHPSAFDRVVAVDAGADHVFAYGGVEPNAVRDLVYGAIFTRGSEELKSTAVFIGGSNVALGEEMLAAVRKSFFGPLKVSVLLDSSGANTTAAAAVVLATRHVRNVSAAHDTVTMANTRALVLGSSGPVGRRVARLLARLGAVVVVGSRLLERARDVAQSVCAQVDRAQVQPVATGEPDQLAAALQGVELVVAAGGPGVCLLPRDLRIGSKSLRVAIDLNAVPPEGIEGVKGGDSAAERDGQIVYGAIGVGGLKMKIHKAAIVRLFESNGAILDIEQVFELGQRL